MEVVDKVKMLTDKLEKGVEEILTSERYKAYLKQMSKFHDYSYRNSLLILLQKEDATLVAGYKTWQTSFNRNVNKGEKGISILAPCPIKVTKEIEFTNDEGKKEKRTEEVLIPKFKPVTVFDVSQTSGEPLKQIALELQGDYKDYDKLFGAIKKCSEYQIIFTKDLTVKGCCSAKEKTIKIKDDMSQIQTIKTLIHEIAHEKLHFKKDSKSTRRQAEVEAESIAFVVSNYFGIDTSSYSFDYISSWQKKDKADVKSSLNIIQETANSMIKEIKNNLLEKEISIADKIKVVKEKSANQTITEKPKKDKNIEL